MPVAALLPDVRELEIYRPPETFTQDHSLKYSSLVTKFASSNYFDEPSEIHKYSKTCYRNLEAFT